MDERNNFQQVFTPEVMEFHRMSCDEGHLLKVVADNCAGNNHVHKRLIKNTKALPL